MVSISACVYDEDHETWVNTQESCKRTLSWDYFVSHVNQR